MKYNYNLNLDILGILNLLLLYSAPYFYLYCGLLDN